MTQRIRPKTIRTMSLLSSNRDLVLIYKNKSKNYFYYTNKEVCMSVNYNTRKRKGTNPLVQLQIQYIKVVKFSTVSTTFGIVETIARRLI